MMNLRKEQVEFFSLIDSILTALKVEKDFNLEDLLGNINISVNPFDFLFKIISRVADRDSIIDFLVKTLTYSLPVLEVGVKGVLLANLKNILSCNADPWIPQNLRKDPTLVDYKTQTDRGVVFNPATIDYKGIFKYDPRSEMGQSFYYGANTWYTVQNDPEEDKKYYRYQDAYKVAAKLIQEKEDNGDNAENGDKIEDLITKVSDIDTIYEMARANDFNVFMWFVMRQCNFTNLKDFEEYEGPNLGVIRGDNNSLGNIKAGEVYRQDKTNILSLCTKGAKIAFNADGTINSDEKSFIELLPFSSNCNSANWYTNRSTYFNYLLPEKYRKPRIFEDENAICNLAYEEKSYENIEKEYTLLPHGNLRFTILPKPAVHTPLLKQIPFIFTKILFNKDGIPDKKGRFSVRLSEKPSYKDKTGAASDLLKASIYSYEVYSIKENEVIGQLDINIKTNQYEFLPYDEHDITEALYECYPGLTVYEFNYDFIMGMQLFDPKTIAIQLMQIGLGVGVGVNVGLKTNKTETAYQMRVSEIIKEIIESDAYEASDCFFKFSNEKYEKLLNDAEIKRAQGYAFADTSNKMVNVNAKEVFAILNEFDDNATLQENEDVFKRAINSVTATITDEVFPEEKYNVELNILYNLIKALVMAILDVLLSPKLMLLFEVNKTLMQGSNETLDMEELMMMLSGLIKQLVIEIRDMILQMIMDWVMQLIGEIVDKLKSLLLEEQFRFYTDLIKKLIEECSFNFPLFGKRKLLDSQLDLVNYADIDPVDKPNDSNC